MPGVTSEPMRLLGNPLKMSQTPPAYTHPPPTLGQDTEAVLCDLLGLSMAEVRACSGASDPAEISSETVA
jgi:formyl-CoA transferase